MLMHKGIPVELRWLIEAKARLAGEFSDSFIAYMPSLAMDKTLSYRLINICVFCGSNSGKDVEFEEAAKNLGKVLAEKRMHLVYGGGNLGLMGCVSKAAHEGGSQVLGIIPKALASCDIIGDTVGR
ncbi:hypothetical protein EZV62_018985 [Acer yangbiense]|uniref:Cytokinin riboside 5'-monophosphate phosphoribohydrolase n=1 Tax=Acer yangbiense TaxID=1000413 RepID=A0A5C7HAC2_9ROSI|nr:hypothetical protein EZV62_018985 [Acer yangbiense]